MLPVSLHAHSSHAHSPMPLSLRIANAKTTLSPHTPPSLSFFLRILPCSLALPFPPPLLSISSSLLPTLSVLSLPAHLLLLEEALLLHHRGPSVVVCVGGERARGDVWLACWRKKGVRTSFQGYILTWWLKSGMRRLAETGPITDSRERKDKFDAKLPLPALHLVLFCCLCGSTIRSTGEGRKETRGKASAFVCAAEHPSPSTTTTTTLQLDCRLCLASAADCCW